MTHDGSFEISVEPFNETDSTGTIAASPVSLRTENLAEGTKKRRLELTSLIGGNS
jgi:hypothetical protein